MKTTVLQAIHKHIELNDIDIAYRKLMDFVGDTESMQWYKKMIDITAWKETQTDLNIDEFSAKLTHLLTQLQDLDYTAHLNKEILVEVTDIEKTYKRNNFSLGPINLTLSKGEVVGLVGENGNGKTTLLTILAKELSYNKGEITYKFNEKSKSNYELKSKLTYIPQRPNKWYGSLQDNLKFALATYKTPAHEIDLRVLLIIARLGLWKYKDLNWNELSSGYKMRFELARTLLRKPEVLLLDEPLANLDILAQQIILEDLQLICTSAKNPIALIMSSQQLYEVEKVSDKVIFLHQGKMMNANDSTSDQEKIVIELDTQATKEELQVAFSDLQLDNISYNGGVYVLYFQPNTQPSDILLALSKPNISVLNYRDISASTRRYFVS